MAEPPLNAGPEGPHAHPRKTGHSRLDLVLALSAVFISGVSLYVAIEHGKTERDLVAANSWPFLRQTLSASADPGSDLSFGYMNVGVGPAKVKAFEVLYDGAPVASMRDLLQRCCGLTAEAARNPIAGLETDAAVERVLRPGESASIAILHRPKADPQLASRYSEAMRRLSFRGCYCSVFDECWTTTLLGTEATPIKTCPKPATPFDPTGGQ